MADFPDNLRPASYRGVPFFVDSHSANEGRRTQEFEFWGRDKGSSEDLGGAAGTYGFDGFVIGDDYMTKRDALRAALKKIGPAELIHPYLGRIWCVAKPFSLSETSSEGGMARFGLSFIEVAESKLPSEANDLPALAVMAAEDLDAECKTLFAGQFSVANQPAWVLDEASAIIAQAQDLIDAAGVKLAGFGAPLNDFIRQGLALKADILTLAASPLSLATSITGTIQGLQELAATPKAALSVLSGLMGFGHDVKPVTGATPARLAQAQNQAAIIDIVTQSAASEVVKAVTEIEFSSYNEAIATRDDLADRLDALALVAGDAGFDLAWQALSEARLAIVRDINFRAGDLAKIITYTPPATMPAILIAHALYGSDDLEAREDDIIARNGISNPNFVVGSTEIEVLNA